MTEFDVAIIGSGLGSLVAGAKLAKEGKKVIILEQHYVPGGCATTFKRKDFVLEVGLHETEGVEDRYNAKSILFKDLRILENVQFLPTHDFYRYKSKTIDLVIPSDSEECISLLTKKYPAEKKGYKKVFYNNKCHI